MNIRRITAPAEPPVSLADLKQHLAGIATDEQDADLQGKLDAAISFVETDLRRNLITATYEMRLDAWPWRGYLDVPLGNLQSVASIKYTDSAGAEHTLDASAYKTARTYAIADSEADPPVEGDGPNDAGIGRICLAYGQSWPSVTLDTADPIVVRFTCGWENAASVPEAIKQAIKMLAGHFFRNRDAVVVGNTAASVSSEMALGVQRLIAPFEDRRF